MPRVSKRVRYLVSPFLVMEMHPNYKVPKIVAKIPADKAALKAAEQICEKLKLKRKETPKALRITLYELLRQYSRASANKRWQNKHEIRITAELVRVVYRELQSERKGTDKRAIDEVFEAEKEFIRQFWPERHALNVAFKRREKN